MTLAQIIKARETLEMLRVKALHNEFSGHPYYLMSDGGMCVIGSMLDDVTLTKMANDDVDLNDVTWLWSNDYIDDLPITTGLSIGKLQRLQNAHDYSPDKQHVRELHNRAALEEVRQMLRYEVLP